MERWTVFYIIQKTSNVIAGKFWCFFYYKKKNPKTMLQGSMKILRPKMRGETLSQHCPLLGKSCHAPLSLRRVPEAARGSEPSERAGQETPEVTQSRDLQTLASRQIQPAAPTNNLIEQVCCWSQEFVFLKQLPRGGER